MEDTLECDECNGDIIRFIASAEEFTKTEKGYGDTTRTVGERVRIRTGWRCACTHWLGAVPEKAGHHVNAEDWPDQWLND